MNQGNYNISSNTTVEYSASPNGGNPYEFLSSPAYIGIDSNLTGTNDNNDNSAEAEDMSASTAGLAQAIDQASDEVLHQVFGGPLVSWDASGGLSTFQLAVPGNMVAYMRCGGMYHNATRATARFEHACLPSCTVVRYEHLISQPQIEEQQRRNGRAEYMDYIRTNLDSRPF